MKKILFGCILLLMFACSSSEPKDFSPIIEVENEKSIVENLNQLNQWENLDGLKDYSPSSRLKVPGGWIVRSKSGGSDGHIHQIFIVDSLYKWRIK